MKTHYRYQGLESSLSAKFLTTTKCFNNRAQTVTTKQSSSGKVNTDFMNTNSFKQTMNINYSQNSSNFFPRGLEQVLASQSCNIAKFKKIVQKQKNNVSLFLSSVCEEISHIIEDFKLSIFAKLDIQYQEYLAQYAQIKNQMENIKAQRKLIRMESSPSMMTTPIHDNKQLILEMKRVEDEYKNQHMNSRLLEFQYIRNSGLQNIISNVLQIAESKKQLIVHDNLRQRSEELISIISRFMEPLYGDLDQFITKNKHTNEPRFNINSNNIEQIKYRQQIPYQSHFSVKKQMTSNQFISSISTKSLKYQKSPNFMVVSPQNLVVEDGNTVSISDNFCVRSLHTDKTLCCVGFKNQIITGGKDSIVTVNSLDGEKVITLRGHKASICCITVIKSGNRTLIASGGDLGDGSIIIWDTDKWGMFCHIHAHNAAVSAIVDGGDGQTIITSSYDKSIKILNYLRGQVVYVENCQKPVIGLAINTNKSRLVSSHLSQIINVWSLKQKSKSNSKLEIKNKIVNSSINSVILFSMTNKQLIVTGDQNGYIKIWNVQTGKCLNSYKCHQLLVVDMILIDRLNNKNSPWILSIGKRDNFLSLVDTQKNNVRKINLQNDINIELGYGIGPKLFMIQNSSHLQLGIVSQSENKKEVEICQLKIQ